MPRNTDIKLGWPYPLRKRFLEELVRQPRNAKYTYPLRFQGQTTIRSVFTVEIDLPKYRLTNGRTQAVQEMYLAQHPKLGSDFFIRDLESEQAQTIQHDLLWKMVEQSERSDHSELLDYFKNPANSQDEPLVLSEYGLVVNGNRRLCAMRELYYEDREKYSKYSHVDVVVLPHCSEKDIDELEAYLQIQPDIKQDYTWIARACMLRARQERYRYTNEQLAELYDISEKELLLILSQLAAVDDYLVSRGKPKRYDLVEKDDSAFKQLLKNRPLLRQADERDLFTQFSFCLIDDPSAAQGRLYERIPEVKENLSLIADRLGEELKLGTTVPKTDSQYDLFGKTASVNNYEPLINAVSKAQNREAVVDAIVDVIDSQKEITRKRVKANAVLKQISEANSRLKNALNYIDSETSREGIEEQLQAVEKSIAEIRKWLSKSA